jgi:CheY-like chemotaxis protein
MPSARIFVVEDNPSDVFVLRHSLQELGEEFELDEVHNGEEALRFVHAQRENRRDAQPCVILLDLHLPQLDGLEILRAIQAAPALDHIHVIATSNGISPQQEAELRRMSAEYRPKPRNLAEYAELARHLIAVCKGSHVEA